MKLLRTPEHLERRKIADEQRRERQRRFPHPKGLIVRSAEGARFAYSERPLPREEQVATVSGGLGGAVAARNFAVNYFTQQEVEDAIGNVLYGKSTGERGTVIVGDRTYTVPIAPYSSHDVEVYHALRNPDALNFVETDDGLQAAPRLP